MAGTIEDAIKEFEKYYDEYRELLNPFVVGSYTEPSPLEKMMKSEDIANKMLPKLKKLLSETKALFKNAFLVLNRLYTDGWIVKDICDLLKKQLTAVGKPLVAAIDDLIAAITNQKTAYKLF